MIPSYGLTIIVSRHALLMLSNRKNNRRKIHMGNRCNHMISSSKVGCKEHLLMFQIELRFCLQNIYLTLNSEIVLKVIKNIEFSFTSKDFENLDHGIVFNLEIAKYLIYSYLIWVHIKGNAARGKLYESNARSWKLRKLDYIGNSGIYLWCRFSSFEQFTLLSIASFLYVLIEIINWKFFQACRSSISNFYFLLFFGDCNHKHNVIWTSKRAKQSGYVFEKWELLKQVTWIESGPLATLFDFYKILYFKLSFFFTIFHKYCS